MRKEKNKELEIGKDTERNNSMSVDTKSNVIKGPWNLTASLKRRAAASQKDWAEKEKMAQDFVFTEELTEAICVKLIQSLSDNKVDVNKPIFQKYLPFLNETIKSYIMGVKGYTHPLQEFVDKIMNENKSIFLKNFTFTNMICFADDTFFFHHVNNSGCSVVTNL